MVIVTVKEGRVFIGDILGCGERFVNRDRTEMGTISGNTKLQDVFELEYAKLREIAECRIIM